MMDHKEIYRKLNLSVEECGNHLEFLKYFDENSWYLEENVVRQAVRR